MSTEGVRWLFECREFMEQRGVIRLELWPEGLVLWVGGTIRWREWESNVQHR